jgi:acyl carrier protein
MHKPRPSIESRLEGYIRRECLPQRDHTPLSHDLNLFEAGIVDSAGLISYICYIEKEFGVTIPDEDLLPENFVSIAAIAEYLRSHRGYGHA